VFAVEIPDVLFYGVLLVLIPSFITFNVWLIRSVVHLLESDGHQNERLDRLERD
jgi:hypothetical protein